MNDPCFGCETFAIESLNDFGDLEVNLLEHMKEEFKYQLDDYVERDDSTNSNLEICICIVNVIANLVGKMGMLSNLFWPNFVVSKLLF